MLNRQAVTLLVRAALSEDAPFGDITSEVFVPEAAIATADLVTREAGVFCGAEVFEIAMTTADPSIEVRVLATDGQPMAKGDVLATVQGPARSVLLAERVALNLVQRMCGIATLTAEYVAQVSDTTVRLTDTRKTTPGLRAIERYAVACGGGHNHRYSLSDAVLAKDNHLALTADVTEAIRAARQRIPHTTSIEVEVDSLEQIEPVLAGGVDTIMLDNFSLEQLREGVALVAGRALVEASGGVNLGTVADIAATGVDVISVGALTHSARNLDLGLDVRIRS